MTTQTPLAAHTQALHAAAQNLADTLPGILEESTHPQALDLAGLLFDIQQARVLIQSIERDTELACAKAMTGDMVHVPGIRVERQRSADRKTWDHTSWQRDVREKALRAHGLRGIVAVINSDGEELDPSVVYDTLSAVQGVHGASAPKVTALRGLGLDPDDYCQRSPGAWHVRVTREAIEQGEA